MRIISFLTRTEKKVKSQGDLGSLREKNPPKIKTRNKENIAFPQPDSKKTPISNEPKRPPIRLAPKNLS